MTLQRVTPPQAARLTIPMMKSRKTPQPTTLSWVTVTKAATDLPTPRRKSETMVAEMDLSSINSIIVNLRLRNTNSVLTTKIKNYMMLTY